MNFPLPPAGWFLESGIQDASGGVARYYRTDAKKNARISTEITGYAVSAHLFFHSITGDERHLQAARAAGDFLVRVWDTGTRAMPFEWAPEGADAPEPLTYFFDCGIIARALLRLWRCTGEAPYREVAVLCAESMLRDFHNDIDIDPVLLLPEKCAPHRDERWSRQPGCYQLKAALAWIEVGEVTGREEFRLAFDRTLEAALRSQGRFLTAEGEGPRVMDRLHAYGYFLEGLLSQGSLARGDLETGIRNASAWLRRIRGEFERSDASAQLLRARVLGESLCGVTLDGAAAEEEAQWAASFVDDSGAFWFGRKSGNLLPYHNPVSTAFCAQALALWEQRRRRGMQPQDWRDLI